MTLSILLVVVLFAGTFCSPDCYSPNGCHRGYKCHMGYDPVPNKNCEQGHVCCKKSTTAVGCWAPYICFNGQCNSGYNPAPSNYVCGSSNQVCCLKSTITVTQKPVTTKPITNKPTVVVTDGSCGKTKFDGLRSDLRIVGGREAKRGEIPWQVQILNNGNPHCGAILLDDQWIISAAHCFDDTTLSKWKFVLGQHDKTKNEGYEQVYSASRIIKHEQWGNGNMKYDIVLIKINGRARFNNYVQPVCMPYSKESFDGQTNCVVSGWGNLKADKSGPNILNVVSMPIVSNAACNKAMHNSIKESNVCGGDGQGVRDACMGDSGGPLACKKAGEPWKIVGIVSWGFGCANYGQYGVYASVPYFANWIQANKAKYA